MCWARSAGLTIANDRLSRRIPYAAAPSASPSAGSWRSTPKQRETFGAALATRQAVQWMIDNDRHPHQPYAAAARKAERGEPTAEAGVSAGREGRRPQVDRAMRIHGTA
jgi:hypothetical protein